MVKFCTSLFLFDFVCTFFLPEEWWCVWVDNGIEWRWDLLGRGRGICVYSGLIEGRRSKKGCAGSHYRDRGIRCGLGRLETFVNHGPKFLTPLFKDKKQIKVNLFSNMYTMFIF